MNIPVPCNGHPSTIQFQQGVSIEDLCEQIKGSPLDYLLIFDPDQLAHREQFKSSLARREIDILGLSPEVLTRLEPGFQSEKTQGIFRELKAATKNESKVMGNLKTADQAVSKSLEIERNNLDPSKVDANRKTLRAQREALEDAQIKVETYERGVAYLWSKFFQSLKDFQAAQVESVRQAILPDVEKFNSEIKAAYCRLFVEKIAPKLRRLNEMHPASPGEIYFSKLHLDDLQLRQLKSLEAFPQIRSTGDRFEFSLEVSQYGKK